MKRAAVAMSGSAAGDAIPARTGADVGCSERPRLELRGVRVTFDGGREALRGVDLELRPGEVLGIVGPNGAGKSTLAKTLAGLVRPREGEVLVDGAPSGTLRRRDLARRIAYLGQEAPAELAFTAAETVLMGRSPHLGALGLDGDADRRVARDALHAVGAVAFADRPLDALSGGERRRVLFARLLAQQAPVWILDEPTTHLDLAHQHLALRLARENAAQGGSTLCVLHDITQAHTHCDRVVVIADGRVRVSGSPSDVLRPELLAEVFGVRFVEITHPESGRRHVVAL